MTTEAFVGKMYLERGDDASPPVFTRVCQTFGIGGLGQKNDLVDATTFCSGGAKEYISGLADGSEITLDLNFESPAMADGEVLSGMISDVKNRITRRFQVVADDEVNPPVTFSFDGVCMSWELGPSVADKNTIKFGVKISGDIEYEVGA